MERDEIRKVLDAEVERSLTILRATRPESPDYGRIIDNLRSLHWVLGDIVGFRATEPTEEPRAEQFPGAVTVGKSEPVAEPVGEPEPVDPEDVPWVEEPLTKEKVRAYLKERSEAGVLIQPILTRFIPEGKKPTFSNVKAADYAALMEAVKNAG